MVGEITALKKQSKKGHRISVYLNGKYAFGLSERLTHRLQVGQNLSDEEIRSLKLKEEADRCYQRGVRLIHRRPRSEFELRSNFAKNNVPEEIREVVISRLSEAGLIDDAAFADLWVENRMHFRPRSAWAISSELRKKGVPSLVIEAALDGFDEGEAALQAAKIAARRWRNASWEEFRKRVGAFLARRGFRYSMIYPVVERVWRETSGDEDESEGMTWTPHGL